MTRVLFVNHSTVIGGAETNLLNLLRFADLGSYTPVGVLLPDRGPLAQEVEALGIPVGVIRYRDFHWRNPLHYVGTQRSLAGWIQRTRADVIHLNHQWLVDQIAAAGQRTGVPVICQTRNYLERAFVDRHRAAFEASAAVVTESNAVLDRARALALPEARLVRIYNGADFERFAQAQTTKAEELPIFNLDGGPVIGYCGRIVPVKGTEDLIRAFAQVHARVPAASLVFCGKDEAGGAHVAELTALAGSLGIGERVHFIGFQRAVEQVLARFDILAIPSRPAMREGLPLTALEGLAAGCTLVATPNSGLPEVVIDGETGFLVQPEAPDELAAGLLRALTLTQADRERLHHNGRRLIKNHFSIEQQATALGKLFRATGMGLNLHGHAAEPVPMKKSAAADMRKEKC